MAEPRKNHHNKDVGQVKEDEHASYKPIPESDTELRSSKSNIPKSQRNSSDGAEEKLLQKEDKPKITTKVDMSQATYVVGDPRNGDAKVQLDAKRQFSGLTKEELLKYTQDPFWVRLRWCLFVLFWALWVSMLAGAIYIIVRTPKCPPPPPKTWFEKGPLVYMTPSESEALTNLEEALLPNLKAVHTQGLIKHEEDAYKVLDNETALDTLKNLVNKAKEYGVKVVVDLTASFVSTNHKWFQLSLNRSSEYDTYFIWKNGTEYDADGNLKRPREWVSTVDTPAWVWNDQRQEFYFHQHGEDKPQLNFSNPAVVKQFDQVLKEYMKTGIAGVRLLKARKLLINQSLGDEDILRVGKGSDPGADHSQYTFWTHKYTSDQPALQHLLMHWAHIVDSNALENPNTGDTVFTIVEEEGRPEHELSLSFLRPPPSPLKWLSGSSAQIAATLEKRLTHWPALELPQSEHVLAFSSLMMLLPAAPLIPAQPFFEPADIMTKAYIESIERVSAIRSGVTLEQGNYTVVAVPAMKQNSTPAEDMLACARWKKGNTGYVAVWNGQAVEAHANLSDVRSLPGELTVFSAPLTAEYGINHVVDSSDFVVPSFSTVVFSYVPDKK